MTFNAELIVERLLHKIYVSHNRKHTADIFACDITIVKVMNCCNNSDTYFGLLFYNLD